MTHSPEPFSCGAFEQPKPRTNSNFSRHLARLSKNHYRIIVGTLTSVQFRSKVTRQANKPCCERTQGGRDEKKSGSRCCSAHFTKANPTTKAVPGLRARDGRDIDQLRWRRNWTASATSINFCGRPTE